MFTKCIVFILAVTAVHCDERVRIDLYYEKFCGGCRFRHNELVNLTSELADYINLHTYPIEARLVNNSDGVFNVKCRTDEECYENRVQLCAIEALIGLPTPKGSPFKYIEFNNCVIHKETISESTVDECGKPMNIPEAILNEIKVCVNGLDGKYLQIKGAWITERDVVGTHQKFIPYLVINGKKSDSDQDMKTIVCGFIKNPPPVCSQYV